MPWLPEESRTAKTKTGDNTLSFCQANNETRLHTETQERQKLSTRLGIYGQLECEPYILPQELDKFIEPLSKSLDLHRQLYEYRHANRGLMSKAIKWAARKRGRQTPEDLLKEKLGDQSPTDMIESLANIQGRVSTAIGLLNGGPKPRAHECLVADTSLSLGLDYPTVDVPPVTVEVRHVEAWRRQLEQFRRQVRQGLEHRDWYSTFPGENKTRQWSYPGQEV
ncbi:hypothetical protein NM208_g10205 [Fusarium decemcellulare]|uniref:Uncharacterized protein n=1 Tax=Fusarium decemcellulare TaxID=57161 RepID=A0ACC1RYR8_9HYPO|nr:hypothetical protein NM208_g10205 [Fusarium decemcellulare]